MPCLTLEPLPRFPGFWSTRTPASRATWTVWSVEPSSTTTTSANSHGEALRYSRTFTREAGNRLASLYAGMIMERERFKRRFIIAYFAIGALFVPRRRLAQTAADADPGNRSAGLPRLRPPVRVHAHGAGDSGGVRREVRRRACAGGAGAHRRTPDDAAPHGQGGVRARAAVWRTPADLRQERRRGREGFRPVQAAGHRRHRGGGRLPVPHAHGRTQHSRGEVGVPQQDAALHAGEVARAGRRGDALPPTLSGPDRQPGRAPGVCDAGADRFVAAPATGSARVHRSGDADDAAALRRGRGTSVRDPPQYAGHRSVPADRAGALFEAAGGGRHGPGVRDQPQLPQRRALDTSQPRVHHAGVLPGVHGLSRADRFLRGTAAPDGD